jgi:tripartite-type tricarboxylate transporter receptor subunit TctC
MKLPHRRQFLHLAAGAAALPAVSGVAWAQGYPTRPVRIVVPLPVGGLSDTIARLLGEWLMERLGQPFVIDNRPGAGTNIGTEAVVRSTPDGYSLLLVTPSNAINATLYPKLSFNFIRDTAPVASIMRTPNTLLVNPSVPAKSVPELIAYARANPGKLNMASAGNGSSGHMAGELFKMMTGVDMQHIPYRGGPPALTDLLGGQVQLIFTPAPDVIEHVKAGRLRALAVTSATRWAVLPDIPTVGDFVPGFEASVMNGIVVAANTPPEIIEQLNKAINAALADPSIRVRLASFGGIVLIGSPADFGKLIAEETEKWAKVIKFAGIKAE